ncbi:MAG: hypothetical protein UX88_C0002G0008 [Candidatus Woesebacteria bacterium GW2011_GWC2_47_16]|uniref:DUF5667 domain-containing protein n=9 Tax=Candidatus Woeseibacteriota TaxID=1752722 RepID=A0A0G1TUE7_9BACT|nr:MAG: hypothetical protein UX03_C0001G0034 [Candidatus Woesebacteria bacterium GW2011_GWE1_45_18]KKU25112.1 MAG: hypothetical protein UX34_C0003G0037 [Candidatus Woesebacteria bacterium GW2011_GWF1_46_13]KKU48995.1 MAG: hypothetical protein UX67_C0006G0003 [Candidatus Woesebacteria bacterium GW2011_GWF2_46_8]KKU65307.1 MAG: hypothetical protein UX88_C0002G0008 [Candidatus Woesebacteria bacterium GW2011_GWC2_47_16]KKU71274.1 MAG: hypothetical protein UX95_C0001G0037 [Candidatus Woesebacteria b
MVRRIAAILSAVLLAFAILSVSVLRVASVNYAFNGSLPVTLGETTEAGKIDVNYEFPYPGRILPDHPLWTLKALRDKLWLVVTVNPSRKAELLLLFADKRIAASRILFEKGKPELAFSTLSKAEKYLTEASKQEDENRKRGRDTKIFLTRLANASLKHREVINEILVIAPEDAKPEIIKIENSSRDVYKNSRNILHSLGMTAPENPFNGD